MSWLKSPRHLFFCCEWNAAAGQHHCKVPKGKIKGQSLSLKDAAIHIPLNMMGVCYCICTMDYGLWTMDCGASRTSCSPACEAGSHICRAIAAILVASTLRLGASSLQGIVGTAWPAGAPGQMQLERLPLRILLALELHDQRALLVGNGTDLRETCRLTTTALLIFKHVLNITPSTKTKNTNRRQATNRNPLRKNPKSSSDMPVQHTGTSLFEVITKFS